MSHELRTDLGRLRDAVRLVKTAAQRELAEMASVLQHRSPEAIEALHESHLNELDAIQMLVAVMELVEKRHPQYFLRATSVG